MHLSLGVAWSECELLTPTAEPEPEAEPEPGEEPGEEPELELDGPMLLDGPQPEPEPEPVPGEIMDAPTSAP